MLTFALEQWAFGSLYPGVAHGFSLFYYIILCFSIFLLIKKLPVNNSFYLAFFTAIIFLVHPIHTNVICNIKSRDTILSLLISVWSLYFFVVPLSNKYISYFLGFLFFALASICKLDSIGLLLIIPLSLFFFTDTKLKRIIFFVVGIVFFSMFFRTVFIGHVIDFDTKTNVGTIFMENPIVSHWTLSNRIGQSVAALFYYLKFMIIPTGYYFYFGYDMLPLHGIFHWSSIVYAGIHFIILLFAFRMYKKGEKIPSYGILFFYFGLAYCSNLAVAVAGIIADRYAFIASLGFCLLMAWFLLKLMQSKQLSNFFFPEEKTVVIKEKKKAKETPVLIKPTSNFRFVLPVILLIGCFYPFAHARSTAWQSILSLMDKDMPHLKKSYEANRIAVTHYLLAARKQTTKDSAQYFFAKALVCANDADNIYPNEVFILESKGISYFGLDNQKAALTEFKKAVKITDSSLVSLDMIGDMLYRDRQFNLASKFYYQTLKLDTLTDVGFYKYISALCIQNKFEPALKFSDSLIQKRPGFEVAYECKGYVLLNQRDTVQSSVYYLKAFEMGMVSINFANLFRDFYLTKNDKINAEKFEKYRFGQQIQANP